MLYLQWSRTRDCNPGIGGFLFPGLQKLVKIVLFRVINDSIKNFSCMKNKIFYVRDSPTLSLCIVICILTATVTPYGLIIPFIRTYTMIVCIIKSIGNIKMTTYL